MTTSKIEIVITTKGQRQVVRGMNAIGQAAAKAGNQTTKSTNRMSKGLTSAALRARSVSRYFRQMEGTIRRTSSSIIPFTARLHAMHGALVVPPGGLNSIRAAGRSLRGLLGIFASFYTARIGVELSDSFTRIGNTLKGFGAAERDLGRLRKRITEISLAARVSSEETATLFGRFQLATKGLGLSEKDVLDVTETVNKALRLSGSSSLEASQSVRQLSQAFNKGKLDGDEFRSVMENAPVIVKLLSEELGVSKTALFDMAREGKISTAVLIRALRKGKGEIDKLFGKLDVTFGDALQNFKTKAVDFLGDLNSQTGAGKALISTLEFVGDHLKGILRTLVAIAAVRVGSSVIESLAPFQTPAQRRFATTSAQRTRNRIATIRAQGAVGSLSPAALAASNAALASGTVAGATAKSSKGGNLLLAPFKKLFDIVKRLVSGPLRAIGTLIRSAVSAARLLLSPVGLLVAAFASMTAAFGSGFLTRIRSAVGATNNWEAAVKVLELSFRALGRTITAIMIAAEKTISGVMGGVVDKANNVVNTSARALLIKAADFGFLGGKEGIEAVWGENLEKVDFAKVISTAFDTAKLQGSNVADMTRGFFAQEMAVESYDAAAGRLTETLSRLQSLIEKQKFPLDGGIYPGQGVAAEKVKDDLEEIKRAAGQTTDQLFRSKLGREFGKPGDVEKLKNLQGTIVALDDFFTDSLNRLDKFQSVLEQVEEGRSGTKEIESALSKLQKDFEEGAKKLPPEARDAAIQAAKEMTTQAEAVLTEGASKIGASVKAAFLTSFGGAVATIVSNIKSEQTAAGEIAGPGNTLSGVGDIGKRIANSTKELERLQAQLLKTQGQIDQLSTRGPAGFKQLANGAKSSASELQNFFESAFGSLEDALVSFVTTGEFDFKKFMNAILADLARLIVRMLIIKPLMSLFGGFFGFAQGGRVPSFATGGRIPKYSGGGMIGGYGGSTSDRYAAMVSPGEAVIRSSQVRANRGVVGDLVMGKKVQRKVSGGGGAVAVTYAPVINVEGGPEGGGEQQGQEIQAVIERGFMELLNREMRPNGALEGISRREFT